MDRITEPTFPLSSQSCGTGESGNLSAQEMGSPPSGGFIRNVQGVERAELCTRLKMTT